LFGSAANCDPLADYYWTAMAALSSFRRHLELVEPHQLQRQRALQEAIAVELDRMSIQRRVHLVDGAIVRPGNGVDALVDELVVIHGDSLPLVLALANSDAALQRACDRAEVLNQCLLLGANPLDEPLVVGLGAAWRARRQRSERPRVGTELPPQTRHAMDGGRRPVQVAAGVVEAQALPAGKLVEKDVPATPAAPTFEPRTGNAFHWLVPDDRNRIPADPKIGRA
jgi:hypothetical protein